MKRLLRRQEAKIPFTKDGYQKVLDEKADLLKNRPEAVVNLTKSREMGDLSENGYYHAAKARLTSLDSRLRHLERLIKFGVIIQSSHGNTVEIGTRVTIKNEARELTFTIVGGYESNPAQKTISHLSPTGRALMGKRVGDTIEVHAPAGVMRYTIVNIE